MSKRVFTVSANAVTVVNAAVTLVFINPAATKGFELLRAYVSQKGTTSAAMQRVQIVSQVSAFPTLVSATPAAHSPGDANASSIVGGTAGAAGTCGVNASAEGGGGKTIIVPGTLDVLGEWVWVPTQDERIEMGANISSGLGLYLPDAPAALGGWTAFMTYREIG